MSSRPWTLAAAVAVACAAAAPPAHALPETAVHIAPGASDNVSPVAGTTHGWQFSVNRPVEVIQLGLYDRLQDGFVIDHPVGLWDGEGALIASVTMSAGAGDVLIGNFRYASVTVDRQGEVLVPGVTYTIGFYSAQTIQADGMVIFPGFETIDPAIDYAGHGIAAFTDGLEFPVDRDPDEFHRFGPNFRFIDVLSPGPAASASAAPFADALDALLALASGEARADVTGDGRVDGDDLAAIFARREDLDPTR